MSDADNKEIAPEVVVDETPQIEETVVQAAEEPENEVQRHEESPEEGIEALKTRLKMAEEARQMAERQAAEQAQMAHAAKLQVEDGNLALIRSAIDTVRQETAILKQHYAAAMSSGAFDKAAEVQEALSTNAAKLIQLENGRVALEDRIKNPQFRQPPVPMDPVEDFANRLSPKSAAWVRAHPDYVTNENKKMEMLGAHQMAVGRRFVPDSQEYFDFIESVLGIREVQKATNVQETEAPTSMAAQVTQKRTAPPPAPSSKIASGNSGGKNVVRLSQDQREAAKIAGMTPEEYAKNMLALKREGKLN